jgi:hypothetical protein
VNDSADLTGKQITDYYLCQLFSDLIDIKSDSLLVKYGTIIYRLFVS